MTTFANKYTSFFYTESLSPAIKELVSYDRWVGFDIEKAPINPYTGAYADCNKPETWTACEHAVNAVDRMGRGIGVGYQLGNGYVLIDFDHCLDSNKKASPEIQIEVDLLDTYTEISPSGDGLHCIAKGKIPGDKNIGPNKPNPDGIEMYDHVRYATVTGNHYSGSPTTIEDRQAEIDALHKKTLEKRTSQKAKIPPRSTNSRNNGDTPYGLHALESECSYLASIPEGGRNDHLNISAMKMGQLVAGGELTENTAIHALENASAQIGLKDGETERTIRSGMRKGMSEPRRSTENTNPWETNIKSDNAQQEEPHQIIGHPGIDKALADRDISALYSHSEIIAMFDRERLAKLKIAIKHIFKNGLPLREFEGLITAQRERLLEEEKRRNMPVPVSLSEFMKVKREPAKPVIPGVFFEGLYIVAGKSKIGKSWLGLNAGWALAYGGVAFGKIKIDAPGEVLYLDLEDNDLGLEDRVNMQLAQHAPGSTAPSKFYVVTEWPRLDSIGLESLENFIKSHSGLRMIIIDPWVKAKPRIKQRAGATMYDADYEALAEVKRLADTYHICILIYFHTRKESAEDPFDEINASSGAPACADGSYILKRGRGEADGTLWGTGRTIKGEIDIALTLKDGVWTLLGDTKTYTMSKERKSIIDELALSPEGMTPKQVADALKKNYHTIRNTMQTMDKAGEIRHVDKLYYSLQTDVPPHPSTLMARNNNGESTSQSSQRSQSSQSDGIDYGDTKLTRADNYSIVNSNQPVERSNGHFDYADYADYGSVQESLHLSDDLVSLLEQFKSSGNKQAWWRLDCNGWESGMIPHAEYINRLENMLSSNDTRLRYEAQKDIDSRLLERK